MPPLPPIPNVVKLAMTFDNQPLGGTISHGANILHLQYPSTVPFNATTLLSVANACQTWWGAHFKPSQSNSWRFTGCTASALDGSGAQASTAGSPTVGTAGLTSSPPSVTAAISWLGAPSYRGGKPRTYICGIPDAGIQLGTATLQPAYCTTLRAAAVAAIGDMAGFAITTVSPVLGTVSYISKAVNPTPPHRRSTPLFYIYTGAKVHERVDSQRRRLGKESLFAVT